MKEKESDILRSICDYLAWKGYFFYRSNNIPVYDTAGARWRALPKYTMRGIPDIVLVEPKTGKFWGLEVKTDKGTISPFQREFEAKSTHAGARYDVVRSIDDVQKLGL